MTESNGSNGSGDGAPPEAPAPAPLALPPVKRGPGRPRKPRKPVKHRGRPIVTFRISADEERQLSARARASGKSRSDYIRACCGLDERPKR